MILLERDLPLNALRSALSEAGEEGCVALVYGEAGIGKTALIEQFVKENKHSWRVLQGACDSLFTPRLLGPLHDIAHQISSPKETQGSLPGLLESESNRTAIFVECLNELKTRSTILVIEDVHWADEATHDLLKYLGRRMRQTTSLVILTYRDDEIGRDHPLRLLLGDLASSNTLHRIPVKSLSKNAYRELANNKNVDALELHRLTNGNPFFVTEILAVERSIPETVRDAVLARAARLSFPAQQVLEAAAVIGSRVEPWLLSDIAGAESIAVEECIAKGMLHSQGDYYAFRHELARQTILESVFPQRKTALNRLALTALKEAPETRHDFVRLANHAEAARDINAILQYAPAAAQQASAASAHREAVVLYELALRYADKLPVAEQAEILEAYAVELHFANQMTQRLKVLRKAIDLRRSIGDRLREGADLEALSEAFYLLGRNTESEDTSKAAIALLEALPPGVELAQAYKAQCYIRMENRDSAEAQMWGEKAIALAEKFQDFETLAQVCNYTGCAMLILDYERGRMFLERSLAISRSANAPFALASALNNLAWMLVEILHPTEAERYLQEGIAYATEHDDDYHLLQMLVWQALARLRQGRWQESIEIALRVLRSQSLDSGTSTYVLLALGHSRVRLGDANAQGFLDEALKLALQADSIPRMGKIQAARLETVWLSGGDFGMILEETRLIYELAKGKQHPWITGELAFWHWRAGEEVILPAWVAGPFALQIQGDWRGAAGEWEKRGCPYEQAMALMDGDEIAQRAALEIFERLGAQPILEKLKQKMRARGVRIPRGPRPATRENPFGLTHREMELLSCLAEGLSNNAIAKKLSLSPRTVEHHIASILQKMGVGARSEAVALALKDKLLPSE